MQPTDDEHLYDAWLDQALTGLFEDPDVYCDRHNVAANADLRERLAAVAKLIPSRPPPRFPRSGDTSTPPLNRRIGPFRLLESIGEGGMGQVFLAEEEPIGRRVALKVLRDSAADSVSASIRLLREARAVAKLQHPNLVTLLSSGRDAGQVWLAFEYVAGRNLDVILDEWRASSTHSPATDVLRWTIDVARALGAAHREGVVHRDVKPSNIRITPEGKGLLLDFGLARGEVGEPTITGSFLGSPAYASPEQIDPSSGAVGPSSDVYSLGVTLYEALSLRIPFEGISMERVFHAILTEDPPPLRSLFARINRDVEVVVARAMEKDPARRYPDADAFADDLQAILDLRPIHAQPPSLRQRASRWRRRHPAAATALAIATIASAGLATMQIRSAQQSQLQRKRDRAEAAELFQRAEQRIAEHDSNSYTAANAFLEAKGLHRMQQWMRLDAAQEHRLATREEERFRFESQRDGVSNEIVALLDRARRKDPTLRIDAPLLDLARIRQEEAIRLGENRDKSAALLQLATTHQIPERLRATLTVEVSPKEADLYLFEVRSGAAWEAGGEPRDVPGPLRDDASGWPIAPGSFALRVIAGVGSVTENDLITQVAGEPIRDTLFLLHPFRDIPRGARLQTIDGVAATQPTVALRSFALDASAPASPTDDSNSVVSRELRFTSGARSWTLLWSSPMAPPRIGSARELAEQGGVSATLVRRSVTTNLELPANLTLRATAIPTPLDDSSKITGEPLTLLAGRYLLVARHDGYETWKLPLSLAPSLDTHLRATLRPSGNSPSGFILVPCDAWTHDEHPPFFIAEHEVTVGDFRQFLEATGHSPDGASWRDGGSGWSDIHPATDVSWRDAKAYATWRDEVSPPPVGYHHDLPNFHEYVQAAGSGSEISFPYGSVYRQSWQQSRTAQSGRFLEPILSYPIDESLYGVRDLAGSVAEWLAVPAFLDGGPEFAITGGSWLDSDESIFHIDHHRGGRFDEAHPSYGFRLVITPTENRR